MTMPKPYTPPQAFETTPRPPITLQRVQSNQIAAAGHSAELQILALQFKPRQGETTAVVYHYPNISAEKFAEFMAAESLGKYHGSNFEPMIFLKYPAEPLPPALEA
jgi:hypothetical protein